MVIEEIRNASVQMTDPETQVQQAKQGQQPNSPTPEKQNTAVATPVQKQEEQETAVSRETLEEAIQQLNHAVSLLNHRLKFSIDSDSRRLMAQVIDNETNEVIREIPPERVMNFVHRFQEFLGLLLDEKA